ncbi:MAG: zinc dependent phospholipase C family protein [Firmicutes bacterium]|nr:zinc dependent phospholipase C family protein [Bacillota bacterium]
MASWLSHLLVAYRVSDLCSQDDERDALYLGSLAPDWTGFGAGPRRRDSHFKTPVPGQYLVEAFVADWCLNVQDRLVRAFRWGYAGHLMVDRLWARRLYMPMVRDDPRAKEVYQVDLRAVDRELACEPGTEVVLTLLRHARRLEPVVGAANGLVPVEGLTRVLEEAEGRYREPSPPNPPVFLDSQRAREVVRDGATELRSTWLASMCG